MKSTGKAIFASMALAGLGLAPMAASAQPAAAMPAAPTAPNPNAKPTYAPDGTVHVPAFNLPASSFSSPQAVDALKARAHMPAFDIPPNLSIAMIRAGMEMVLTPSVKAMQARYPADIVTTTIAGVPVRIVTPQGVKIASRRILINLHGGGFSMCADGCAVLESLPIAAVGGYKVISVNYRQGPEAHFPAASEDVAAVYRELLKTYKPTEIGIYGCSAGGALSGEVAAWLPAHGLPEPGAIGIFGSGAARFKPGDSGYVSAYIDGSFPAPTPAGTEPSPLMKTMTSYFANVDPNDPLVSPAEHLDVLAKFPPTLIITGTRAPDLSPAVFTHSQLIKAGVPGDLIVGEGLGHCYIYGADIPEAQDAFSAIAKFFQKNLH